MNWTPQCPKAEAPGRPDETRLPLVWTRPRVVPKPRHSVWTQPRVFQKPTPQRALRRRGSRQLGGERSARAEPAFPGRVREAGSRSLPANGNVQTKLPSQFSGGPAPEGRSAESIKLQKFKLKWSQISHDFS